MDLSKADDLNCLSYWFPRLLEAGLPVPKTEIVLCQGEALVEMWRAALDGDVLGDAGREFIERLSAAVKRTGEPCFLRTGQGSGKHEWSRTCCVPGASDLFQHTANLIEWSEMVGMLGLPFDVWAVRELLPTKPLATLPAYKGMPLCREFRCFVRDGEVECVHPYWPRKAIEGGFPYELCPGDALEVPPRPILPDDFDAIVDQVQNASEAERAEVRALAEQAAKRFDGYWSVDILETHRGWCITDMAIGEMSFHWPECERKPVEGAPDGEV